MRRVGLLSHLSPPVPPALRGLVRPHRKRKKPGPSKKAKVRPPGLVPLSPGCAHTLPLQGSAAPITGPRLLWSGQGRRAGTVGRLHVPWSAGGPAFLCLLLAGRARRKVGAWRAAFCGEHSSFRPRLRGCGPSGNSTHVESVLAWAADLRPCPPEGEGPQPTAQLPAQRREAQADSSALLRWSRQRRLSRVRSGPRPLGLTGFGFWGRPAGCALRTIKILAAPCASCGGGRGIPRNHFQGPGLAACTLCPLDQQCSSGDTRPHPGLLPAHSHPCGLPVWGHADQPPSPYAQKRGPPTRSMSYMVESACCPLSSPRCPALISPCVSLRWRASVCCACALFLHSTPMRPPQDKLPAAGLVSQLLAVPSRCP